MAHAWQRDMCAGNTQFVHFDCDTTKVHAANQRYGRIALK